VESLRRCLIHFAWRITNEIHEAWGLSGSTRSTARGQATATGSLLAPFWFSAATFAGSFAVFAMFFSETLDPGKAAEVRDGRHAGSASG
jgi:hypothetical protein